MGTRSLVRVKDDGKIIVTLYRQYDGYPTGMGKDILDALNKGKCRIVNGYSMKDESPEAFNGLGDVAAYLVGHLKFNLNTKPSLRGNPIGNVYLYPSTIKDAGQEYEYTLTEKDSALWFDVFKTWGKKKLYSGFLADFNPDKLQK